MEAMIRTPAPYLKCAILILLAAPSEEDKKYFYSRNFQECENDKTTKTRVSNSKLYIGEPLPGDKCLRLNPDIRYYVVEDECNYDGG